MYELCHLETLGSTVSDTVAKLKPVEPFAIISKDSSMGSAMPTEGEIMRTLFLHRPFSGFWALKEKQSM